MDIPNSSRWPPQLPSRGPKVHGLSMLVCASPWEWRRDRDRMVVPVKLLRGEDKTKMEWRRFFKRCKQSNGRAREASLASSSVPLQR